MAFYGHFSPINCVDIISIVYGMEKLCNEVGSLQFRVTELVQVEDVMLL